MSKMETSTSLHKMQSETKTSKKSENYSCKRCNAEFEKPIFAVITSNPIAEGYYACPKCLSKIQSSENNTDEQAKPSENTQNEGSSGAKEAKENNKAASATCAHHTGYLKKRPKNTPVPEECFTCSAMIDCMSH
jgi:DNA-directed RNA polymerase subunit RPC12/RpoP